MKVVGDRGGTLLEGGKQVLHLHNTCLRLCHKEIFKGGPDFMGGGGVNHMSKNWLRQREKKNTDNGLILVLPERVGMIKFIGTTIKHGRSGLGSIQVTEKVLAFEIGRI